MATATPIDRPTTAQDGAPTGAGSIEIILPNNIRQRFYNPNVEQPWIRRVK